MAKKNRPTVAIHKFSSCDGCQLAFLNLGENLLTLTSLVDIKHFAEAGYIDETASVDIAFIEGSISTQQELQRIKVIRKASQYLITIGACATSGGIQALRNMHDANAWVEGVYASPKYIDSLTTVTPVKDHIAVDFEIWGCPVSSEQVVEVIRSLLSGVTPVDTSEKVCAQCKRSQIICRMVVNDEPCLGPVTKAGCGAICPAFGRGCYACYGPSSDNNTDALVNRFHGFGLLPKDISQRFLLFNNNAPEFREQAKKTLNLKGSSSNND